MNILQIFNFNKLFMFENEGTVLDFPPFWMVEFQYGTVDFERVKSLKLDNLYHNCSG